MEYPIPVKSKNLYKCILMILNFKLNLSDLEIDIVSTILNNGITTVDTTARDIIRKELNTSKYNTNNYIIRLKNKGVLLQGEVLYLNPIYYEFVKDKEISFKFQINDNDN